MQKSALVNLIRREFIRRIYGEAQKIEGKTGQVERMWIGTTLGKWVSGINNGSLLDPTTEMNRLPLWAMRTNSAWGTSAKPLGTCYSLTGGWEGVLCLPTSISVWEWKRDSGSWDEMLLMCWQLSTKIIGWDTEEEIILRGRYWYATCSYWLKLT